MNIHEWERVVLDESTAQMATIEADTTRLCLALKTEASRQRRIVALETEMRLHQLGVINSDHPYAGIFVYDDIPYLRPYDL